jgi:hypothetical protein
MTDGEELPGGVIRATATFRRNGCYQNDLTGEILVIDGQVVIPCPDYRSPETHLRVSDPLPVTFGIGQSSEMLFQFPDLIPLDATDLFLQVYYTGEVGAETESFALGAVDVSEPTYITVMNATDVFGLSGAFYYWQDIIANIAVPPYSAADVDGNQQYGPPDPPVEGRDMIFEISVNEQTVGTTAVVPQGRFARIAAIVDPQAAVRLRLGTPGQTISLVFSPRYFQHYGDQGWRITLAEPLRDQTIQYASATLFLYYPTLPTSIDSMPPSRDPAAAIPVPVQMGGPVVIGLTATPDWTRSMNVFRAIRAKALTPMAPMAPPNLAAHPRRPAESPRIPLAAPEPTVVRAIARRPSR